MSDNVLNDVSINSFSADLEVTDTVNEGEIVVKNGHSPYIGTNGNWYEWDDTTEEYNDTGVKAEGPKGDPGEPGADGTDASLPTGSSSSDILVWGGGGTWTPTDFSVFVTENITATTYQFTATGMTDGSTITSAASAVTIGLSVNSGLEHRYMIQTGQQSAISLQPYTLATDQNGIHLGLYTILDDSLYYAMLTAASANTVLTGTMHVVDLTAKELPTVSSSDEGKFLRVSSQGTWIADTVPSAEGSGF